MSNAQLQAISFQSHIIYFLYWHVAIQYFNALNIIFNFHYEKDGIIDRRQENFEKQPNKNIDVPPTTPNEKPIIQYPRYPANARYPSDIQDIQNPTKFQRSSKPLVFQIYANNKLPKKKDIKNTEKYPHDGVNGILDFYKSPIKKLLAFFKKSRDQWKSKCLIAKKELKLANKNVKNLRESKKKLQYEIKDLKLKLSKSNIENEILSKEIEDLKEKTQVLMRLEETAAAFDVIPARQQYPVGISYLYISLVLSAASSFRGAGKSLEIFMSTLNPLCSTPSWTCGRLWLLRLGYYKLTRLKDISDDWIWIIDHVVQLGQQKCLAIYGIRKSHLSTIDRSLTFEDLEPLAIIPVAKSNGDIVLQQLKDTIETTSVPREIIGDHGSDIKKGIDQFCLEYPETSYVHDIKHKIALIAKKEFEGNDIWEEFIKLCSQTKKNIQQTPLGFLIPKNQRTKARYMNIDATIVWGVDVLEFIDEQHKNPSGRLDPKIINDKIGWVKKYSQQIKEWSEMLRAISLSEQFIREKGICENNYSLLKKILSQIQDISPQIKRFKNKILDFVKLESLKAGIGEKLLGSSEIIESAFGKLKEVEKSQSKSGFTGLILMLSAMVSKTDMDTVSRALESVPVQKVFDWCEKYIGKSEQSNRKTFLKGGERGKFPEGYKKREQKRRKPFLLT